MQLFTNRRFLFTAFIILLLTWVMFVTSRERTREGRVEYFFNTAMAPLENIFNSCNKVISDSWDTVTNLGQLKVENEKLRAEINYLRTQQLGLNTLKVENQRLREAIGFESSQPHQMIAAEIIAVNPSNWRRTLIINKGENIGLKKNMAVISPHGVVGRIGEVRPFTAEVILLTDPREGNFIGGVVARTQNMVIITGGGDYLGQCTVKPAVDNYFIDLKKNDLVVTAETSDKFPRGVPIGRVVSLTKGPNSMVYKALLKPAVNLRTIQIVYVIKTKKDLPNSKPKSSHNTQTGRTPVQNSPAGNSLPVNPPQGLGGQ